MSKEIQLKNCTKLPVTKNQIEPLCSKYNINQILASILVRRGISQGEDILYFLENDIRFQHSPFCFPVMEDIVERIFQAQEEGEKVLIFGDSDVDGITSTAILYSYLKKIGIDAQWKLPVGDDGYGLSIQAIDDFAKEDGSLIITVDCGISNFESIEHANNLQIDVIVTDHHNPQETLPEALLILDPKLPDSNYPFMDISGAAVAYKLVSALRFAKSPFYNTDICILDVQEDSENQCYNIDCLKVRNLNQKKELHQKIIPGVTSISQTKLPDFLSGNYIYVWDKKRVSTLLRQLFGSGIDFNLCDLQEEISKLMPVFRTKSVEDLYKLSSFTKYFPESSSYLSAIFNLYVTYVKKFIYQKNPIDFADEKRDLQLVTLAALADIMPMKNENRIFVKSGLNIIKNEKPCTGLAELFAELKVNSQTVTSTDLSWTIIPALNAAGRMGQSNLSLELLLSEEPIKREQLAKKIVQLNEDRKEHVSQVLFTVNNSAKESLNKTQNKLCIVVDESINKGVTGILASKLMKDFGVPSIAATITNDVYTGSLRSCRGFIATEFLDKFGDFFINHGGHDFAAGFSFYKDQLDEFYKKLYTLLSNVKLETEEESVFIDAELPPQYLTPEILDIIDIFEPYGAENQELTFLSCNVPICDALLVGKKETQHLKLVFDCGKYKIPAMYWSAGNKLNSEIFVGKKYNVIYSMNRNYFNGIATQQLIIKDIELSN